MKIKKLVLAVIAVLLVFSFEACRDRTRSNAVIFALKAGNYWEYSGKFNDKKVTCRIEVKQVVTQGRLTFALMRGFPADVMDGEDWEASVWGLLVVDGGHYYKVSGPRIDTIANEMLRKDVIHSGLVTDADLFLEALCDTGQIFGEASQLTRDDGNYFWKVTEKHAFEASSIKGLKISGNFDRYTIHYQTVADDVTMDVVPGIGIARYRYCHHGTPGELDLKLTEAMIK